MSNINDITILLLWASTQLVAIGMILLGWNGQRRRSTSAT